MIEDNIVIAEDTYKKNQKVKSVYNSGIFEKMVGDNKEKGEPPKILKDFFAGDIDLISGLENGKDRLEVGCGHGRLLKNLSEVSNKVVGIDFSEEQVKKALKQTSENINVNVELMNAENMNFKDDYFDEVLCLNCTLGNMPGIELRVLNEMKRVVKRGGRIIVRVFANNEKVRLAQHENYKRLGFTGIKDEGSAVITDEGFYSRRFSKDDLQKLFNDSGMEPDIREDGEGGFIVEAIK